jgi:hypothetical protein
VTQTVPHTETTRRDQYIASLHELADWLQANPDIPAPRSLQVQYSAGVGRTEQEAVAEVVRVCGLLGVEPAISSAHVGAEYVLPGGGLYIVHVMTRWGASLWHQAMEFHQTISKAA